MSPKFQRFNSNQAKEDIVQDKFKKDLLVGFCFIAIRDLLIYVYCNTGSFVLCLLQYGIFCFMFTAIQLCIARRSGTKLCILKVLLLLTVRRV